MRTDTWGRALLFGAALVGAGCAPFELPEKFTEPAMVVTDGGDGDAGVFATDFTSCPELVPSSPTGDGGVVPPLNTIKVELQSSLGFVDVASSIPVGCQWQAKATALLPNNSAAMPQPVMTWSTGGAGVLTVDASGVVTGIADGITSLDVAAGGKTGTRQVWVGGDALLNIAPLRGYGGFPESLHGTAASGALSPGFANALFTMRKGTGLDAVERGLFMQGVSVTAEEGRSIALLLTYREFGERLPGRVRDFSATIPVLVEQLSPGHARLTFTDAVLRGTSGAASFSGHLEFSIP
jgi:hypothetical protein